MKSVAIRSFGRFSSGWAKAFKLRGFKVHWVDPFDPDALEVIRKCDAFFCTISQDRPEDLRFLPNLLDALEATGHPVYPDRSMRRAFDDKLMQHWLFKLLGFDTPAAWLFFDIKSALKFIDSARYPMVFKLARGAGSQNVRLVSTKHEARSLVMRMFRRGLKTYPPVQTFSNAVNAKRKEGFRIRDALRLIRSSFRLLATSFSTRNREHGYVLFQEFIGGNECDYRVTIIGDRAFVFYRRVRNNDFRASGSGRLSYPPPDSVDHDLLSAAFIVRDRLGCSMIAMDFVKDFASGAYLLLEHSFSFVPEPVGNCPGFFDRDLQWNPTVQDPEYWMVDDFISATFENQVSDAIELDSDTPTS
ncbi:MAG: hypothetical protein GVY36_02565 [Verrucomicrobia bacterium]|jgi:glutathione synthase/RimK-type ligase-like ATP-grasp enzyme|nr:hypothetical protein [Verrucomicrobiota bacterium]